MEQNLESERLIVLTRDTYPHLMQSMLAALPRPATDQPADIARRERAAIAEVAAMRPANAEEVALAIMCVTASEHAMDILSRVPHRSPDALKHLAKAASMMRESHATQSLLLRVQAARVARESGKTAVDSVRPARPVDLGRTSEGTGTVLPWRPKVGTGANKHTRDDGADLRPVERLFLVESAAEEIADGSGAAKPTRVLH